MVIRRFAGAIAAGAVVLTLGAGAARAQTINFDFEDVANTWNPPNPGGVGNPNLRPGALVSFPYAKSGLTLTISRNQTSPFDIVNNVAPPAALSDQIKHPAWGLHSLDPFAVLATNDFFIFNLSSPVSAVTLDFGDYGFDADTGTLTAFAGANGTGANLGSSAAAYAINESVDIVFRTVTVNAGAPVINSFTFAGTSSVAASQNQGLFLDNIRITVAAAAPEPGVFALLTPMLLGGAAVARRRRCRR